MIVKATTWLDKEIGEVEVIMEDEKYEIECFSYLFKNEKIGVQSYGTR